MDPSLTKNNAADMTTQPKRTDREQVDLLVSGLLATMAVPAKPKKTARRAVAEPVASRAKVVTVAEVAPVAKPAAPAMPFVDEDSSAFEMLLPYDYD